MLTGAAAASTAVRPRLVVAGTSHHVAPLAVRERLAQVEPAILAEALHAALGPAVVVATCNRLEVYCWTGHPRAADEIGRQLARLSGVPAQTLRGALYRHTGAAALEHLVRVAAGLDSLALGEAQITGQVRRAWQAAATRTPLGPELQLIFARTVEAARRVRAASDLGTHPSVASLAVEAASHALGGLAGRHAAVLGAGATAKLAAQALLAAGVERLTLLNRTEAHAAQVTRALGATDRVSAGSLDGLAVVLQQADVVVGATASSRALVTAGLVTEVLPARSGRPLALVDVAVPRDVEPEVAALPGVTVIDLDTLAERCPVDARGRQAAIAQAETHARDAARAIGEALALRDAVPEITELRSRAELVRQMALSRAAGKLRDLTPREQAAVEQLTYTIVQKLLHAPTVALRQAATGPGRAADARQRRSALLAALAAREERTRHVV